MEQERRENEEDEPQGEEVTTGAGGETNVMDRPPDREGVPPEQDNPAAFPSDADDSDDDSDEDES